MFRARGQRLDRRDREGDRRRRRQREWFARLRTLADSLSGSGLKLDTLSMGMSGDFEAAIQEGATIVRVGTAIFGARTYP